MNPKNSIILGVVVILTFAYFAGRIGRQREERYARAIEPTPVPTVYVAPEPEPTPEPTAVPQMFRVSLVLQNNANGGQWLVACPDGCPSVGDVIHEDNGTWFNDVNNKFVWIKPGSGSIVIEER